MDELIERNYQSIVKRGKITDNTKSYEFIDKLQEEINELSESYHLFNGDWDPEELADVILTALNMARHYNLNIKQILLDKIKTNENRHD